MWLSTAILVHPLEPGQQEGHVSSPNKKYLLSVEGYNLKVVKATGRKTQEMREGLYLDGLAEVGWSKDSKASLSHGVMGAGSVVVHQDCFPGQSRNGNRHYKRSCSRLSKKGHQMP